jgi:outer membrane protein TolC
LRIAVEQQPALAARRASLAAAEEGYRGATELRVPVLFARDLPIRRQQACLGITIAAAGLSQAEWETLYSVTRTYFGVIYARQQLLVLDELVNILRGYQELVGDLVKKGDIKGTTSSFNKITVYLGLAEGRKAEALRGIDRANAALREAMGVAPETNVRVAEQKLPTPQVTPNRNELVALALSRRGEMIQVAAASRVADLEVEAQAKHCWPLASTFASGADIHAHPVPQGISNHEYRPGATGLEMPSNLVGPRASRVEHARDLSVRAAAVVDKTRNLIALEAEDMFFKWEEASRRVPQSKIAQETGNNLAKDTRADYRQNLVKIEEVLTNEALAAQAAAAYNEALYNLVVAVADLQRVTAGGFNAGFGGVECVSSTPPAPEGQ